MTEYEERLERIRKSAQEASTAPLIYKGWVCDHPEVKRVWFIGYLISKTPPLARMKLMIEFTNGNIHSIDSKELTEERGSLEEDLALKGDEYLRNGGRGHEVYLIHPDEVEP